MSSFLMNPCGVHVYVYPGPLECVINFDTYVKILLMGGTVDLVRVKGQTNNSITITISVR